MSANPKDNLYKLSFSPPATIKIEFESAILRDFPREFHAEDIAKLLVKQISVLIEQNRVGVDGERNEVLTTKGELTDFINSIVALSQPTVAWNHSHGVTGGGDHSHN